MQFAVFTVSMPSFNPNDTVTRLAELGYDGVEWRICADKGDTDKPSFWKGNRATLQPDWSDAQFEEVAKLTREADLAVPNLGTYLDRKDLTSIERMMQVANIMGSPSIRVSSAWTGSDEFDYRLLLAETVGDLAKAVELGRKYGVKILLEIHHGTIMPSASAALRLVEHFCPKEVGVIHDAGNMIHEGFENLRMGLDILGPYLHHVHVKSSWWKCEEAEEGPARKTWKCEWAPLREGVVDFEKLFEALRKVGYDGWLSVEDFSQALPEDERLADNIAFLREMEASHS